MKRQDMKAAAKFSAACETCGQKHRSATAHTVEQWMRLHEAAHRADRQTHDAEMAAARDADRVARADAEGEAS